MTGLYYWLVGRGRLLSLGLLLMGLGWLGLASLVLVNSLLTSVASWRRLCCAGVHVLGHALMSLMKPNFFSNKTSPFNVFLRLTTSPNAKRLLKSVFLCT